MCCSESVTKLHQDEVLSSFGDSQLCFLREMRISTYDVSRRSGNCWCHGTSRRNQHGKSHLMRMNALFSLFSFVNIEEGPVFYTWRLALSGCHVWKCATTVWVTYSRSSFSTRKLLKFLFSVAIHWIAEQPFAKLPSLFLASGWMLKLAFSTLMLRIVISYLADGLRKSGAIVIRNPHSPVRPCICHGVQHNEGCIRQRRLRNDWPDRQNRGKQQAAFRNFLSFRVTERLYIAK